MTDRVTTGASIAVFCGSATGHDPRWMAEAWKLGGRLAERGLGVVYGGASVGLMGAVADGALSAGGEVVGVLPHSLMKREVAHPQLTEFHLVSSMHERKALMAERASAFVALPGGFGTLDEIFEVLTWAQLGLHRKPCALLSWSGFFAPLVTYLDHAVDAGFVKREHRDALLIETETEALLDRLAPLLIPASAP